MSPADRVAVLATGGTIDKVYSLAGDLEIGPPAAQRLLDTIRTDLDIDVRAVLAKDSLDITDDDRAVLAAAIADVDASAVVITHGTDTLTLTAEYLQQHLPLTEKVIVLTGSLQPAAMAVSDAAMNLGAALLASQILAPGIYVCMAGRAFRAGHVKKDPGTGLFTKATA